MGEDRAASVDRLMAIYEGHFTRISAGSAWQRAVDAAAAARARSALKRDGNDTINPGTGGGGGGYDENDIVDPEFMMALVERLARGTDRQLAVATATATDMGLVLIETTCQ